MTHVTWPLLLAVIGGALYLAWPFKNQKVNDLGRITFCIAMFWLVYTLCHASVGLP